MPCINSRAGHVRRFGNLLSCHVRALVSKKSIVRPHVEHILRRAYVVSIAVVLKVSM
jgi:hypothetical protein